MKRNQSSLTAAGIAIVRALESEKPADERVAYDPYARRFVNGALFQFVNVFYRLGWADRRGPGVWEFIAARERYIDDFLQAGLDEGLEQLVILGAGYDARAYRFEAIKRNDVRVFEVDHPATQAAKLRKLSDIFGVVPGHVTYVPVDFNEQTLQQRLFDCGYDEHRKTLFIWQGVTQYLAPEAVDETLAFVRGHSAPGSSIIFDYLDPEILQGSAKHGEVATMRRNRRLSGEMLVFGIPIAAAEAFLVERGFTGIENADHKVLERRYYANCKQAHTVADGYAIASGIVPAGEG